MMNQDEQEMLSEHSSLWEMTRSGMAIRKGIENRPRPEHVMRMRALCRNVLEPLRRRFGMIRITSGYRCPALNIMVRGARNSQHQYGEAADIHIASPEEEAGCSASSATICRRSAAAGTIAKRRHGVDT